jgi:(p)ppGpp synthase/HD superfamily hydrolase
MKFEFEPDLYSDKLLAKLEGKLKSSEIDLVKQAIHYVKNHHGEQRRDSGDPYYSHPIEVAIIVADYYTDVESIVAAILHDTVEDTEQLLSFYKFIFGKKIVKIIAALTKLDDNVQKKYKLSDAAIYEKLRNVEDQDVRVLLIKSADRLHNMRTIEYKPILVQKKKAEETLKIYVPMASYLKAHKIEEELKYLALKVLN